MVQPLWKTVWRSLKKLKIVLPYEPEIALQKLTRQEITIAGEDVEKGDPSYIVSGNASWYSHSGKQCGGP